MAYRVPNFNFPEDFYLDDVGVWRLKKEKLAEMKKPKPQTNEKWLRSCSTERLAEWLSLRLHPGVLLGFRIEYRCSGDIEAVRKWLQEVHQ